MQGLILLQFVDASVGCGLLQLSRVLVSTVPQMSVMVSSECDRVQNEARLWLAFAL